MDPEFGDDLLNGFSDEEIDYGEGGGEEEREEESGSGLDLLTAMLDSQATKKQAAMKGNRKRSGGRERHDSEEGEGVAKRRKITKSTENAKSANDEVSQMKVRMQEMEREMMKLREEVKKASEAKRGECATNSLHVRPSRQPPPAVRTEATRLPMSGEKKRVARQSSASQKGGRSSGGMSSVGEAGGQRVMDRGVANDIIRQRQEDEQGNVMTEKYSRLRIKNPLVSSDSMRQRMNGRKMIPIPKLHSKVKDGDIEGDWVTIGVIVDKLPPRDTVKGDKYAIWKLSDLSSQTAVISLFLFGKSYQEHWKTSVGTVVALLNPNIMPGKESAENVSGGGCGQRYSSLALSLDNPLKLMVMGVSKDFTVCRAVTKSGKKCTNFASHANGGHCDYHIQSAYSKMRAQRMEFQAGYGPNTNKGKLKERLFKDSKTDVYYYGGKTFTDPGRSSSSSRLIANERGAPSERMFVPGAHATASKAMEELRERREAAGLGGVSSRGGVTTHEGSEIFKQMLQTQSVGARMLSKHFHKEDLIKKKEEKRLPPEKSASQLLQEHKTEVNAPPLYQRPQLGRGIGGDGLIDLTDRRRAATAKPTTKAALAKIKALEFVHKNGPLEGTESQRTKKSTAISKRVEENRREENKEEAATEGSAGEIKKQCLDSAEFQRILNAKSSHDWVVKEEEREREEEYFDYLEKKENIEEKMASLKELRVNVVQCKLCKYIAESQSELCRKEQHHITRFKALKRCFQCKGCHERRFTYNAPFPIEPCRKCDGMSFEATSFYRERKGPKLPTEQLLLRGEEEKFLNSLK